VEDLKLKDLIKLVTYYKTKVSDMELEFLKLQLTSQSKLQEQQDNYLEVITNTQRELSLYNDAVKALNEAKIKIKKLESQSKKIKKK
jgi:hypothetical protein